MRERSDGVSEVTQSASRNRASSEPERCEPNPRTSWGR
jgi:hypothetical protein